MKRFVLIFTVLAIIAIGFVSCEKPQSGNHNKPGNRNKWVGTYNFTTIDYERYYTSYPNTPENLVIIQDTINFIGTIEKYKNDRLKITFKPNAKEPGSFSSFPIEISGIIYPIVDKSDSLTYPEFNGDYFGGSFLGNEVNIGYGSRGPLGKAAHENHTIHGIKINKK